DPSGARSTGIDDAKQVRQILGANRAPFANDHRTLDNVAQLAHVAGPGVRLQRLHALLVGTDHGLLVLRTIVLDEHLNQLWQVLDALSQRRQLNSKDAQTIVEIGAQQTVAHGLFDIAIG